MLRRTRTSKRNSLYINSLRWTICEAIFLRSDLSTESSWLGEETMNRGLIPATAYISKEAGDENKAMPLVRPARTRG